MKPASARRRREGWPWPAIQDASEGDAGELRESRALVHATALAVARLSDELRLAVRQLEEAQMEERVTSESVATRAAVRAIAQARRRID